MEEQESEPHTKATYGELAKAGRARADVYCVALNDIASEIGHLLTELGSEKAHPEHDERRFKGSNLDDIEADIMEDAAMIERIDGLEALHGRVGDTASQILKSMKMNAAGPLLKSLQLENSNMKRQLDDAKKVSELQRQDAADKAALIKLKENDLRDLRDEIRVTKEKLKEATLKLKETVAMQAQQKALSPEPVVPVPPPTLPKPAPAKAAAKPEKSTKQVGIGTGSEPPDELYMFKVPNYLPASASFDDIIDGMEDAVKSLGSQLQDGFAVPDMSVGSFKACLFDNIESVRRAHKAAVVDAIMEAEANAAAYAAAAAPPNTPALLPVETAAPELIDEPASVPAPPGSPTPPPAAPPAVALPKPILKSGVKFAEPADNEASKETESVAKPTRKGSLRGGGGLENETERAQRALFEAKQELAKELAELDRVRTETESERERMKDLMAQHAAAASDAATAARVAELEAKIAQMETDAQQAAPIPAPVGASDDEEIIALKRAHEAAMRSAEARAADAEEEARRGLQSLREELIDQHALALQDVEKARAAQLEAVERERDEQLRERDEQLRERDEQLRDLKMRLKATAEQVESLEQALKDAADSARQADSSAAEAERERAAEVERKRKAEAERERAADAARAKSSANSAELEEVRSQAATLKERVAQLEAVERERDEQLRERDEQLRDLKMRLKATAEQVESLEQALKDATDSARQAGGSATELLDARSEIIRLKKLAADQETEQVRLATELAELNARRTDELADAEKRAIAQGKASADEAVEAKTAELRKRIKQEEAQFRALQREVKVGEEQRASAETALAEAAEAAYKSFEWAQYRTDALQQTHEARLLAALASRQAMAEREGVTQQEAAEMKRALGESRRSLEAATQQQDGLERALAASQELVQSLTDQLEESKKKRQDAPPVEAPAPAPAANDRPASASLRAPGSADDEAPQNEETGGRVPLKSDAEIVGLLERTQQQLEEVAELAIHEREILLGGSNFINLRPDGAVQPSSTLSTVAGSGSRIAWLMRDSVGTTAPMRIRGAVRPARAAITPTELRNALRLLFGQQRTLATKSAVGNWEVLGAMMLLRPKQLALQSLHDGMLRETNDGGANTGRRYTLEQQMTKVAALSERREQQRRRYCQIWELRRQAVSAVQTRLTSQTLYALTKLTDAANVVPASAVAPISPLGARAPSATAKRKEALAASIFGAPPILPFMVPEPPSAYSSTAHSDANAALGPSVQDWAAFSVQNGYSAGLASGGGGSWAHSAHELWGRGGRLSSEQMQRLVVAAHHWPTDFAELGASLQRQVLAEAVSYCISGPVHQARPPPPRSKPVPLAAQPGIAVQPTQPISSARDPPIGPSHELLPAAPRPGTTPAQQRRGLHSQQ